jgi:hypothetical protein
VGLVVALVKIRQPARREQAVKDLLVEMSLLVWTGVLVAVEPVRLELMELARLQETAARV